MLNVIDTEKATSTLQDLALVSEASAVVITSQAVICEATTMAEKKGVPMKTEVRTGDPASVINELSGNYDLIIMGTKGAPWIASSASRKCSRKGRQRFEMPGNGHKK